MILLFGLIAMMAIAPDHFQKYARAVRAAMEKSRTPLKSVASDMGEDVAQVSRELSGVGHFSVTRLARVADVEFHRWLPICLAAEFGMPTDVNVARQLERAL